MASIPLPALHVQSVQPENPLDQFAKIQQIQQTAQQIQQGKLAMQDQQGMRRAFSEAGGDFDKTIQLASQYNVSPTAVQKFQQSRADIQKQLADKNKVELDNLDKQHENLRGAIKPIMDLVGKGGTDSQQQPAPQGQGQIPLQSEQNPAPGGTPLNSLMGGSQTPNSLQMLMQAMNGQQPQQQQQPAQPADPLADKKQALWSQQRARVLQNPQAYGIQDLKEVPPQYPGDDQVRLMNAALASGHNLVQEENEKRGRTPESQFYNAQVDAGTSPAQAYSNVQNARQDAKPDTATQNKQRFQNVVQQLAAEGGDKIAGPNFTDPRKLAFAISNSKTIPAEDKQFAQAYIAANPTPASTALNVVLRGQGFGQSRPVQVLDTKNGNRPITINMDQLNAANSLEPGRYLSATGGTAALTKTGLIEDIRGGIQQVRDSLSNPNMPEFTAPQRVKIASAMRDRNPKSAVESLISSGALGSATPEQEDYLINHASLAENAMAMRSVLGAGQGSQDLRTAILDTIPGPTTPSKAYGLKQLDRFENTLDRLERGIPSVSLKPMTPGGSQNGNQNGNQNGTGTQQGSGGKVASGMVRVQLPGHPAGNIPAKQLRQFLIDNPDAQLLQGQQ